MEDGLEFQKRASLRQFATRFVAELGLLKHQLLNADLNPHEGRLRSSVMAAQQMDIPDYPPIHDDTL